MESARLRVRANTMTRSEPFSASTALSSAGLRVCATWTMYCSTVSAVSPLWAISTNAGSCSSLPTLFLMDASMVAENSSVWREAGVAPMIFFMAGQKPMSSMRSASSSTSTSTSPRRTAPCSMRSTRRPGVAMRMSTPCLSLLICGV